MKNLSVKDAEKMFSLLEKEAFLYSSELIKDSIGQVLLSLDLRFFS